MDIQLGLVDRVKKSAPTYEDIVGKFEDQLYVWAEQYIPEHPTLAEDLVQETKLHVLKLLKAGCFSNCAYEYFLSKMGASLETKQQLNEQLVMATMESVLDHHFINPNQKCTRNYSDAKAFIDDSLRKIRENSGSLQEDSDIFYFVTGQPISGTKPSIDTLIEKKKGPTQEEYIPDAHSVRRENIRESRKNGKLKSTARLLGDAYTWLKRSAREYGISRHWASRIAKYAQMHGLSVPDSISLVREISSKPEFEVHFKTTYRQEMRYKR